MISDDLRLPLSLSAPSSFSELLRAFVFLNGQEEGVWTVDQIVPFLVEVAEGRSASISSTGTSSSKKTTKKLQWSDLHRSKRDLHPGLQSLNTLEAWAWSQN
jgi:hypothetical protein